MPSSLVECIPNFSEARRPEVIEAIVKEISSVPGTHILDRHSDLDHNRTVITYVGSPDAVVEAAFLAIKKAAELIDLNHHTGAHPRMGATDVVPFVPLRDISMQECVEMARRLGKRVGEELQIPVYLYEEAATRPTRKNLEDIRRGEYEGLKQEIEAKPEREPDYGPRKVGPAGGTVIGARQPLVAYNVYLTTDDVSIAQNIAKVIRHSSGGLRFVKALGLLVEGRAQVSMNLTNFRQTAIARAVEMIRREAARYGVGIHHSELVGLIPQDALIDAATWYLQLDGFKGEQILEQRLYEARAASAPSEPAAQSSFLDDLARGTPTPGGGCAAAFTAAEAAGLVCMVARLTTGKKKYIDVEPQMWQLIEQAEALRGFFTGSVRADAAAFEAVMSAGKLPKETPEQQAARDEAIQAATRQAIAVPLDVARQTLKVMDLAIQAASLGNINAISDGATAFYLSRAALSGAGLNVRINLLGFKDAASAGTILSEVQGLERSAAALEEKLREVLSSRGNIQL